MISVMFGRVIERDGPSIGPPNERTYTVRWTLPDGAELVMAGCGTRRLAFDGLDRMAFENGALVMGAIVDDPTMKSILIVDIEPYAVGCE